MWGTICDDAFSNNAAKVMFGDQRVVPLVRSRASYGVTDEPHEGTTLRTAVERDRDD